MLNAQSIKCEDHNNELQCIISEQKPDIIAITETWLKPDIPNSDIIPDYFSVYRKDRPGGKRGSGVLQGRQTGGGGVGGVSTPPEFWMGGLNTCQPPLILRKNF